MNQGKPRRFSPCARSARRSIPAIARWGVVLLLLVLTRPVAAVESVLMLGVLRDGKLDAKVSRAVHERLTRAGETAPPTTHLLASERQCVLPACLDPLAGREKAQLVLSARVQQSAGFAYIAAFMYDVAHQRSMDVSAVCDKCLPEALALRVGNLYERLLRDYRDRLRAEAAAPRRPIKPVAAPSPSSAPPSASAPATPPAAVAQSVPAPPPPAAVPAETTDQVPATRTREPLVILSGNRPLDRSYTLSPRRKLLAGILGGLGLATLAASIALHATDGHTTSLDCAMGSAMSKVCVLDNKVAYTLGYALTSVFAVSVGMTLFWPEPSKSTRSEVK